MARHPSEPIDDWHNRATATYWRLITQTATDHTGNDPEQSDDARYEAFADWYAASIAALHEKG